MASTASGEEHQHGAGCSHGKKSGKPNFLLKILGIDRFTTGKAAEGLAKAGTVANPFDLGFIKNCYDFWGRGRELGVDYTRLYDVPEGGFRRAVRDRKRREKEERELGWVREERAVGEVESAGTTWRGRLPFGWAEVDSEGWRALARVWRSRSWSLALAVVCWNGQRRMKQRVVARAPLRRFSACRLTCSGVKETSGGAKEGGVLARGGIALGSVEGRRESQRSPLRVRVTSTTKVFPTEAVGQAKNSTACPGRSHSFSQAPARSS